MRRLESIQAAAPRTSWLLAGIVVSVLALGTGVGEPEGTPPTEITEASTPEASIPEATRELCHDDVDNDGNGLVDCDDLAACKAFPTCGWILGGWVWIWTIYDVTLGVLLLYAGFVTIRLRKARSSEAASHD